MTLDQLKTLHKHFHTYSSLILFSYLHQSTQSKTTAWINKLWSVTVFQIITNFCFYWNNSWHEWWNPFQTFPENIPVTSIIVVAAIWGTFICSATVPASTKHVSSCSHRLYFFITFLRGKFQHVLLCPSYLSY